MFAHDAQHNGQAETSAMPAGLVVKKGSKIRARWPVVFPGRRRQLPTRHRALTISFFVRRRRSALAVMLDGLRALPHQIHQHLLKVAGIAAARREALGIEIDFHANFGGEALTSGVHGALPRFGSKTRGGALESFPWRSGEAAAEMADGTFASW